MALVVEVVMVVLLLVVLLLVVVVVLLEHCPLNAEVIFASRWMPQGSFAPYFLM